MWYKNAIIYLLPDGWQLEAGFAEKLEQAAFTPCMGLDWFSEGFAPPTPFSSDFVFTAQNSNRVCLKHEEKVLPSATVRDLVNGKVAEIEEAEARNVWYEEKQQLKEQIVDDLLPRALTQSRRTEAIFDTERGFLLVNEASDKRAEQMLIKLREALGGLKVSLPHTRESPSSLMTEWLLQGYAEGGFKLGYNVLLQGVGDVVPKVKISKKDLTHPEVIQHAKNGMKVVELELKWREQISFTLTQNFALKRIQFLDVLQEEAEQGDDTASLMFSSQIIMVEALGEMINKLVNLLGGWEN
jgi:recombination associated protein RdgC